MADRGVGEGGRLRALLRERFPALRSRDYRLLWLGQTISAVGTQMQVTALLWHVYALTHSTTALGLTGLFRVIPLVSFSLVGGAVADAHDRRKVMFVTQTILALAALALAALTHTGRISAVAIYAISMFSASAIAFDNPARQSLIPNLVPREHFPNAASLNSMSMQTATILGPMLAGLLIAHGSLAAIYAINGASFGAVILALAAMRRTQVGHSTDERGRVDIAALKEGIAFVRRTPILVWTIALDFLATFFSSANALLPVFARDVLHVEARGYGALTAAPAFGSLVAGGLMAVLPAVRRQGLTILWAVLAYGLSTIVFGASRWFWLSWLALAGTGASDTVSTILRQTIRQLVSPDRLRGRMTAVNMIFFQGGPQLGNFEAGVVARWIGAPWSVITGGIGCLLAAAWVAIRAPVLRDYEDRHAEGVNG